MKKLTVILALAVLGLGAFLIFAEPPTAPTEDTTVISEAKPADQVLKIGFMTTLSGRTAQIGQHMKDGFQLAIDHAGGKLGGLDTEVVWADDQQNPEMGRKQADALINKDKVHFVSGIIWSNVMMAVHGPITQNDIILVGANAGPSPIAGAKCHKNFFSTSWQNGVMPEALGIMLKNKGIGQVHGMAPNYQAGKDMLAGFERGYDKSFGGTTFTRFPGQLDFQVELTNLRAGQSDGLFVFYPGAFGIAFLKQYNQAGLKDSLPLYSVFTSDETTLSAQGDMALGTESVNIWAPNLGNAANQKFVSDFEKKYGYVPSFYAAQSYDAARLIASAVKEAGGDLTDKEKLRNAMRNAKFDSVRGNFAFNSNQFPIQDVYRLTIDKREDGTYLTKAHEVVSPSHKDAYATDCKI